jgi:hypothetical protein
MLAHILVVLLVHSPAGPIPVGMKSPMLDMAACVAYLADKTPIVVFGARPVQMRCIDEPSHPGEPI